MFSSHEPRVSSCSFGNQHLGDGNSGSITLCGHLTDCINKAYSIVTELMGNSRWRFTSCLYQSPRDEDLASAGSVQLNWREIR